MLLLNPKTPQTDEIITKKKHGFGLPWKSGWDRSRDFLELRRLGLGDEGSKNLSRRQLLHHRFRRAFDGCKLGLRAITMATKIGQLYDGFNVTSSDDA